MYRRYALLGAAVAMVVLPLSASADSLNDLEARLQSLLLQLASLNQQIALQNASSSATSTPSAPAPAVSASPVAQCIALTRVVKFGDSDATTGGEVSLLQHFLAATLSDFPSDNVTGHFGPLTLAALKEWQSAQGIASSGDANSTGWGVAGPKTRAALSAGCANPVRAASPAARSASISIRVGVPSPLSATLTAVVNTKSSCSAQTYALDYGDGSAQESIVVPGGTCAPISKTFTHTYAAPGTYPAAVTSDSLVVPLSVTLEQSLQGTDSSQGLTSSPVDVSCAPPSFPLPVVQPITIGTNISVAVLLYTDTPDRRVSLNATGTPPGMLFTDQPYQAPGTTTTSHLWSLVGEPNTLGTYQLSIDATNSCGGTLASVQVSVVNPGGASCAVQQQAPTCQSWQSRKFLGLDANGCSMGYICY